MVATTFEIFQSLFTLFWVLGAIVGTIVIGLLVYLVAKYRAKGEEEDLGDEISIGQPPPERGSPKAVMISLLLSATILVSLIIGTFGALDQLETPPEEGTLKVRVFAFQWGWRFKYPNGYQEVGVLRVPVGEVIVLEVTSEDVFHSLGIYDFKAKIDAIPGVVNTLWFIPKEPGEYTIQCFELCGVGHAVMIAKLVVMEPEEFKEWYEGLEVET